MPPMDGEHVTPKGPEAAAGFRRQGEVVAGAGVDLIITEMMVDIPNAVIVTEAALATGLPVWHGLSAEFAGRRQDRPRVARDLLRRPD